jgi:hypothetical protein
VLFAVIDIIGSIPIILNLKQKGRNVNANKATGISFALLIGFFYAGDMMLKLFQVDIASFAVAGAFVIFLMSLEMILDIEIFKNQGPIKEATLVPLVFPLLAGAGAFTTLLSLRYGFTSFSYDVDAPTMKDPTWGFPEIPFSYDGIKTTVTWAELLAGIKVNVYKNFYMGWSLRYRIRMNIKKAEHTEPWYIPGFGKNNSTNLGVTYSLIYKLPF